MRNLSLAPFIALLASACTAAGSDPGVPVEMPAPTITPVTGQQPLARAADGPGFIAGVAYVGTGCEGDSATSALSPDNQVVTSTFSAFVAAVGPGSTPQMATRNCLTIIDVNVPAGWSYALESVDHRGFVALDNGVTASRQSLYMISGSQVHVTPPARFKGATNDNYTNEDVGPDAPGVWSPCGGGQSLWIATQIQVDNGGRDGRQGQLVVDTIDTELQWRRCQ
jgi:hypothetical protein